MMKFVVTRQSKVDPKPVTMPEDQFPRVSLCHLSLFLNAVLAIALITTSTFCIASCGNKCPTMPIDVFGRQSVSTKVPVLRGPPGDGFKRTANGHFDMENKLLRNTRDPEEDADVATLKIVRYLIDREINMILKKLEMIYEDINEMKHPPYENNDG